MTSLHVREKVLIGSASTNQSTVWLEENQKEKCFALVKCMYAKQDETLMNNI